MLNGRWVVTRRIAEKIGKDEDFALFITDSVNKFLRSDWGETCEEDSRLNDKAVISGEDRIVARYDNIFIITEWDRSVTTILFTDEY